MKGQRRGLLRDDQGLDFFADGFGFDPTEQFLDQFGIGRRHGGEGLAKGFGSRLDQWNQRLHAPAAVSIRSNDQPDKAGWSSAKLISSLIFSVSPSGHTTR